MRVELVAASPLRFADGSPVRAASGITRYADGWLVVQDDATHACVWRDGVGSRLRLLPPVRGLDVFEEGSGTKALKPDLEAATTLPDGRILILGSGSTPVRMRSVLLSETSVLVAGLAPAYERVADAVGATPAGLNLEGACVLGEVFRWFQRGLPAAGVPSASVDVPLTDIVDLAAGSPAALRVSRVRHYDLGDVGGVPLAVTDAAALPDGTVLVSAAAEDSVSTYDDGPLAGSALALLDGETVLEVAAVPDVDGRPVKLEGLALAGPGEGRLHVVAVVDADDPGVPSLLLELDVVQ